MEVKRQKAPKLLIPLDAAVAMADRWIFFVRWIHRSNSHRLLLVP